MAGIDKFAPARRRGCFCALTIGISRVPADMVIRGLVVIFPGAVKGLCAMRHSRHMDPVPALHHVQDAQDSLR